MEPEIYSAAFASLACLSVVISFTVFAWLLMKWTSPYDSRKVLSVIRDRELLSELARRVEVAEQEIQKLKNRGVTKLEKMEYGDYISLDLYAERESKAWPLSGTHPDRR